jgi:hypothetical protein
MTVARLSQELTLDELQEWFAFLELEAEQNKTAMDEARRNAGKRR